MVIVGVLVAVVALCAGAVAALRGRGGGEVHSVEDYRHTLQTLQGMRTSSTVRVLGRVDPAAPDGGDHPEEAGPAPTGRPAVTPQRRPLAWDDTEDGPGPDPEGNRETPRQRTRAMAAMNHRPRRVAAPVIAVGVVAALVVALIAVGARSKPSRTRAATATTVTTARHPTRRHAGHATATTSPTTSSRPGARSRPKHHAPATTTTTTTTAPRRYSPTTSSATAATYVPPAASYALAFTATVGPCWLQLTKLPGGETLYAETLDAGQQESLRTNGTVTVLIGAPSALRITLDGVPVVLPAGYQTPLTLTFAPAAG